MLFENYLKANEMCRIFNASRFCFNTASRFLSYAHFVLAIIESRDGDTELTVRVLANGQILPNPGRGGRPGSGLKDGRGMKEFSGQRGARTESRKQAERAGGELEKKSLFYRRSLRCHNKLRLHRLYHSL